MNRLRTPLWTRPVDSWVSTAAADTQAMPARMHIGLMLDGRRFLGLATGENENEISLEAPGTDEGLV